MPFIKLKLVGVKRKLFVRVISNQPATVNLLGFVLFYPKSNSLIAMPSIITCLEYLDDFFLAEIISLHVTLLFSGVINAN